LLRLLLLLNNAVWTSLERKEGLLPPKRAPPEASPRHSISSSDGRCVQRAGTESPRTGDARLLEIPRSRPIVTEAYPHHDRVWDDCRGRWASRNFLPRPL